MSGLRDLMDGYLATRRALGFKLVAPGKTLDAFVGWMEEAGEPIPRDPFGHVKLDQINPGLLCHLQRSPDIHNSELLTFNTLETNLRHRDLIV